MTNSSCMTDDGLCTACAPNLPHRRAEFPPRHRRLAHGQLASVRCCAPRRGTLGRQTRRLDDPEKPGEILAPRGRRRSPAERPSFLDERHTAAAQVPPGDHAPRRSRVRLSRPRSRERCHQPGGRSWGSESDPVAAVKDLEANEKKPRGGGFGELKMALPKMPRSAAWSPRSKASKPSTRLATFACDDPLGCEHALARNHQDADQAYGYAVTGIVTISSCAVCQATTGEKR